MIAKLSEEYFQKFKDFIYKESGITFTHYNRSILESRLLSRLKEQEIENYDEYFQKLIGSKAEITDFIDSITTNLTKSFRNDAHFEALHADILPELIARNRHRRQLKIWSAGCSTGEEPYSVLMSIIDLLPDYQSWDIQVYASDISLKTLLVAKQGFYPTARVSNVPPETLKKYFTEMSGGYEVKPELRKMVKFDYHNLMHVTKFTGIDLAFCRNVIIYFDEVAQQNVINIIYNAMAEYGYFFIGHSESLFNMKTNFILHKSGNTTLYRKDVKNELKN